MGEKGGCSLTIPVEETMCAVRGYQRYFSRKMHRMIPVVLLVVFVVAAYRRYFFVWREGRANLEMESKCIEFMNKSVDECLEYKSRHDQNREFAAIRTELPLVPLKMTKANAVFLYTYRKPHVVIKRCILQNGSGLAEDEILMSLNDEHVVKFHKSFRETRVNLRGETETIIWVFMEHMDVKVSLESVKGSEEKIREIARDMLLGLDYLHRKGIAHLDLKISNVMGKMVGGRVIYKLIDLGFARKLKEGDESAEIVIPSKSFGTYPYKPPEISQQNIHGIKGDIWCFGATVWFLSMRQMPFYFDDGKKDAVSYKRFTHGKMRLFFRRGTSSALKDFVTKCMSLDRFVRPSASELLKHPFITGSSAGNATATGGWNGSVDVDIYSSSGYSSD